MENALKLFFPPRCFSCGREGADFCRQCLEDCVLAKHFYCLVCDKPSAKGKTHLHCLEKSKYRPPKAIFSAFEYSETVRKCIKTAKYRRKVFAPLKILALEALKIMSKTEIEFEGYLVVPVPLSRKRSKLRGFNQAGIVAGLVAKNLGLSLRDDLLERRKETTAQYERNRKERFANLNKAFICKKNITGEKILLLDDICTTGATLLEGSRALYKAGAEAVSCFTLAKKF